ncbi:MAG: Tat pathway signal protein [Phenylobacterium sp.]|nr:Tat pathway signal protein [Phenylobacterium sp.]
MLSRRLLLLSAGAGVALAGCASSQPAPIASAPPPPLPPAPPPPSPEAQLSTVLDQFFAEVLEESPELATSLGLDTGAHAVAKSKLHEGSLAAQARRKARTADQLARLTAIDRQALTGMPAVNYDSVLYDLQTTDRANKRFAYGYEGAGAPYVLSQINGAYQEAPDFLASQHTIETRADADAYVARLGELGRLMDEEAERTRRDAGLGVIPPDFALKGAIGQMKTLHAEPAKSTLVTSLVDRAREKGIAGDWEREASAVYQDKVLPALERQMALLQSLQPKATHDAGVWRLPDGEAYYAEALQAQTTTTMTPAEVHQLGLDVTKELHARADVLFKKIGMTKGSVGERYGALYKSKKGVYPNTDTGKAKEVADLNAVVQAMQKRLPEYFATLPKAGLLIQRIPKATEAGASTHYTEGSLDGARPGIYWLNLRDTAEAPMWDMYTTTYHEGIPGHHLQISLQRQADLPMLRKAAGFGAYVEGWALYSEQLAQEMGMYEGNPLGELGYVHDALLRSGRLVTDTGLHAMRWSREKAIATLSSIDGDPPALAAQEIERYSVWPGQACSYMVGKLTILKLRDKAKAALGPSFDIRQFHDAVLLSGSMPLTVLENAVGGYVAAHRA